MDPDYARKGIATKIVREAIYEAEKRNIKRLEAEVATENIPSIKLARKFNFKIEGRRKKGILLDDGRYIDTYIFGKIL